MSEALMTQEQARARMVELSVGGDIAGSLNVAGDTLAGMLNGTIPISGDVIARLVERWGHVVVNHPPRQTSMYI